MFCAAAFAAGFLLPLAAASELPETAATGSGPSTWAFFPSQRCSEPLRELPRCRSPEACQAACLAMPASGCGGYDSDGRLYSNACASSRIGGTADLFVRQLQASAGPRAAAATAAPHPKIEHFVVLYMENRPFDHILGCMVGEGELPGADGINGTMRLWTDASHVSSVDVTCGTAPYVCSGGGQLSNFDGLFPKGSSDAQRYPYGRPGTQSVDNAYANGARPGAGGSNSTPINMFSGDQLPVKRAIVRNFGTFNKMFSATPTNSQPNHMFTQSAT